MSEMRVANPAAVPASLVLKPAGQHERARRVASSWVAIRRNWQLYAMLVLPVLYILVFKYWPMYGVQIAFRNFNAVGGITGSPWVGWAHFERFVHAYNFWQIIQNTLLLSAYSLAASFPFPIILALALNYTGRAWFRRTVQMVGYAPFFISIVVLVGMVLVLLDPRFGLINHLLGLIGIGPFDVMGNAAAFRHVYVWSGVWQYAGFNCIIYLAALTSVDPTLHEAAIVDGANKLQRIRDIDLPTIMPVAVVLLILEMGSVLSIGFEKVLLLQNPINLPVSEVIDTYVYRVGLAAELPQFSYAAAIGLFQSVIAFVLIVVVNQIAKRMGAASLW
jgi:multiple sugar transport system permease protein/putative aldouronate transport system permease protein